MIIRKISTSFCVISMIDVKVFIQRNQIQLRMRYPRSFDSPRNAEDNYRYDVFDLERFSEIGFTVDKNSHRIDRVIYNSFRYTIKVRRCCTSPVLFYYLTYFIPY